MCDWALCIVPLQVTGCSSGLGAALARELHAQKQPDGSPKYRVYATARRVKALEALESEGIHSLALDVSSESSVQEAVASVLEAEGRIDLLVNNAGLACFGPLAEQSLQEVQTMLDTNVVGVLRMIQVCENERRGREGRGCGDRRRVWVFICHPNSMLVITFPMHVVSLPACCKFRVTAP